MTKKLKIDDIPELPGYLSVAAVAERYGISKGTVYHMIYESARFTRVYKVTKGGDDLRPLLLLDDREVEKVFAANNRAPISNPELKVLNAAWNKRVKAWATLTGWTQTPVTVSGRPQLVLQAAYLAANPEDPKPGT